jgi:hypothetical protein
MARFDQLKPDTQKRKLAYYAKHQGLTPQQVRKRYDAGTLGPQTGTRGHSHTPERPERAHTKPEYQTYAQRRDAIITDAFTLKQILFAGQPKWHYNRALSQLTTHEDGKPRNITELRTIHKALAAALDEDLDWQELIDEYPELEDALYYH